MVPVLEDQTFHPSFQRKSLLPFSGAAAGLAGVARGALLETAGDKSEASIGSTIPGPAWVRVRSARWPCRKHQGRWKGCSSGVFPGGPVPMICARKHHDWPKRAGLGSVQFDLHCSPLFSSVLCGTGTREPQPVNRCNSKPRPKTHTSSRDTLRGGGEHQVFGSGISTLDLLSFLPSCSICLSSAALSFVRLSSTKPYPPFRLLPEHSRAHIVISTSSTTTYSDWT